MPKHPRRHNGLIRNASRRIPFFLPNDGTEAEGNQSGPPQNEMQCQGPDGSSGDPAAITEGPVVADGADAKGNDVRWSESWNGVRQSFVTESPAPGAEGDGPGLRPVRTSGTETMEAAPDQAAYFRDAHFVLIGIMNPDGSISVIEPLAPPAPEPE